MIQPLIPIFYLQDPSILYLFDIMNLLEESFMNNLFGYIFQDFFRTKQFIEIIDSFEQHRGHHANMNLKTTRKDFRKYSKYKKFRRNLILKSILASLFLGLCLFFSLKALTLINNEKKINSGSFLLLSLWYLFILFMSSSVVVACCTLNSFFATSDLDESRLLWASLVTTYLLFLFSYFFTYENTVINIMYGLQPENQYKVKSILEVIRTFIVFTFTAIVFSSFNSFLKSLSNRTISISHSRKYIRNRRFKN